MTLDDAKRDADRVVEVIVKQVTPIRGARLKLTDFADEECYYFFKGSEVALPLNYHRMVTHIVSQQLAALGAKTEIVVLDIPSYWEWLESNDLTDAPENRERFIVRKTS